MGSVKMLTVQLDQQKKENIGLTWPFNGDVGLVFRSAHFATYCVILSVNFEPLYIGPIMSASAEKGDRKREIEQSPIRKNSRIPPSPERTSTMLLLTVFKLALKEQQSTLNSVVNSAVRDAVDSVLIPTYKRPTSLLKS